MSTRAGVPTAGLYGLSVLLLKLFREQRPLGGTFALDLPEPTFRHTGFEGYKQGRSEAPRPEGAREQLERLPSLIQASGLAALSSPGFEADDVLATLARELAERGQRPLVVSGDRDCFQTVKGPARMLYVARGVEATLYDEAAVVARYALSPALLPDYIALVGDPSDRLPGVAGIGPRIAARLLQRFGSIAALVAQIDAVDPPRIREALRPHLERLVFFRDLAALRDDVPLAPGPRFRPLDTEGLSRIFAELEFTSLLPRLTALAALAAQRDDVRPAAA